MEIYIVVLAFFFGFLAKQINLPPLVGFLTAGFILNYFDVEATDRLQELSEVGIILLLFSIGLKVHLKKLFEPQVWGVASLHMLIVVILFGLGIFGLSLMGFGYFGDLDFSASLLLAFALSFSSTVFAVKILEEKGDLSAKHGRLAIGILVMQDLFAVIFITISKGELPSIFALGLLVLLVLRKPLMFILDKSGHGELLVLLACILPIAGANAFEYVGLKPDLGALLLGMLLAGHHKTDELAKAMFGFKDLFLVGFFLTIGMAEFPKIEMFWTSCFLVLLIPIKVGLFYLLLTRFALRARTSLLTSLNLANYSEFGLIVGAVGVSSGWFGSQWLVIIAVALSLSMVVASPVATVATKIYSRYHILLKKFETQKRLPGDAVIDIGDASVVVLGMGRVGAGAYESLCQHYGRTVIGVDFDDERVQNHVQNGRFVIQGDAGDYDFWQRGVLEKGQVKLVLLTMSHPANLAAANRINSASHSCTLAATSRHDDEILELKNIGVDMVFNIFAEAGSGFSDHVCSIYDKSLDSAVTPTL
ncbi:MAG: cation:proton antiporter [Desulfobulbaceae bacterium]|nr:cation:proton antiporter [Desulfobulbaceae bacterium]